jgi:hypothetical protein
VRAEVWRTCGGPTRAGEAVTWIPAKTARCVSGLLGGIERVNERSDVFGLGALLRVMLTGKPPYAGKMIEAVKVQAVQGKLDDCFARPDASGAAPRSRAGGQAGDARTSRRRGDLLEAPKPTRTKAVRHQGRSPISPSSFW